mmetsp:Transcript_53840/g.157032  ORF Transcript_53840/g.157032 Transcript_53840/m.157032 type:complete len:229 (+) Transcript_53840:180-866(+)
MELLAPCRLGVSLVLAFAFPEARKRFRRGLILLVDGGLAAHAVRDLVERRALRGHQRERDAQRVHEIQLSGFPEERHLRAADHWHLRGPAARRLRVAPGHAVPALQAGRPRGLHLRLLIDGGLATDAANDLAQCHEALRWLGVYVHGQAHWRDAVGDGSVVGLIPHRRAGLVSRAPEVGLDRLEQPEAASRRHAPFAAVALCRIYAEVPDARGLAHLAAGAASLQAHG